MRLLMVILTAMFVAAKLAHVVAWSWWVVLTPLWIYLVFAVFIFILMLIAEWHS